MITPELYDTQSCYQSIVPRTKLENLILFQKVNLYVQSVITGCINSSETARRNLSKYVIYARMA